MIKWQDYFDKVVFINNLEDKKYKEYQKKAREELKRVGINDELIESYNYVSDTIDQTYARYLKQNIPQLNNIALEDIYYFILTYKIIEKVYDEEYKNVLFLSNKFKFKNNIEQILQNLPPKGDLILLNTNILYDYKKKVNKLFFKVSEFPFTKDFILNRKGMRNILNFDFKDFTKCIDNLNTYSVIENVVEQVVQQSKGIYKNSIYLTNYNQDLINLKDPITPTEMNICFCITTDIIDKLYPILYSLLKYSQSKFNVYIILDKHDVWPYYKFFEPFQTQRMKITLFDNMMLQFHFNPGLNHWKTNMSYFKLLIPSFFAQLDRILYLDYDTIIANKGIEHLYNIDFKDNYYLASLEEMIYYFNYNLSMMSKEKAIFQDFRTIYFNSGILLFNIKKIRNDGADIKLLDSIKSEYNKNNNKLIHQYYNNTKKYHMEDSGNSFGLCDQSLFNYLIEDNKIVLYNPVFNSMNENLYNLNNLSFKQYIKKWGFKNLDQYDKKIIIYHYVNYKPWNESGSKYNIFSPQYNKKIQTYIKLKQETDQYLKGFKNDRVVEIF